jgi:hypothetical protein
MLTSSCIVRRRRCRDGLADFVQGPGGVPVKIMFSAMLVAAAPGLMTADAGTGSSLSAHSTVKAAAPRYTSSPYTENVNRASGSVCWPNKLGGDSSGTLRVDFASADQGNKGYPPQVKHVAFATAQLSYLACQWNRTQRWATSRPRCRREANKSLHGCP